MKWLTPRNASILRIIVQEYINTWELVWSKSLLKKYNLWVSPATVRNDMAKLEELWLVYQPYNSAGRYPTTKGMRIYINYMIEQKPEYFIAPSDLELSESSYSSLENNLHRLTYSLSQTTWEISFLILEEEEILKYSWISSFVEKNQKKLWENVFNIIRVLEEKNTFIKFISSLNVQNNVTVIFWEETKIAYLKDYSIILRTVEFSGKRGYIGLIWSLRMDYSFNISALRGII